MSSTEFGDDADGFEAAGLEGVELTADPAQRVSLDAELLALSFAEGRAALLLEDRRLAPGSFFARPLVPRLDLAAMDASAQATPEGFAAAVAAWHQALRGTALAPDLVRRLAETAADLAEAEAESRAVPDHIYTLY